MQFARDTGPQDAKIISSLSHPSPPHNAYSLSLSLYAFYSFDSFPRFTRFPHLTLFPHLNHFTRFTLFPHFTFTFSSFYSLYSFSSFYSFYFLVLFFFLDLLVLFAFLTFMASSFSCLLAFTHFTYFPRLLALLTRFTSLLTSSLHSLSYSLASSLHSFTRFPGECVCACSPSVNQRRTKSEDDPAPKRAWVLGRQDVYTTVNRYTDR